MSARNYRPGDVMSFVDVLDISNPVGVVVETSWSTKKVSSDEALEALRGYGHMPVGEPRFFRWWSVVRGDEGCGEGVEWSTWGTGRRWIGVEVWRDGAA